MQVSITLVAGPVLGVLLLVGALEPRAARGEEVVFEDQELRDWQFLVPPGDPEIEIQHSPADDTFLTVRHHHTDPLSSLKRSIQGSPQAQYDPATSGAVETFSFSGRFRAHYEGVGPAALYLTRSLSVQAVLRQGDQSFVALRVLFAWVHSDATLDQWLSVDSGPLLATDFWLDAVREVHPDFSPVGEPMTLALRVSSFYQTSNEEIQPDNTFAVDIDDVRVTAEVPTAGDLPRLSFRSAAGLVQMTCGTVAQSNGHDEGSISTSDLIVQLSETASSPVSFRMLRNGAAFVPPLSATAIGIGRNSARIEVDLPSGHHAELFELAPGEGATIGEPSRLALLSHAGPDCAFVVLAHWRSDLRAQGCEPVGSEAAFAPGVQTATGAGGDLIGLTELQALRDEVMVRTSAGRYYAELYKTLSPAIVRTLVAHPSLLVDLFLSQDAWVEALATLTEGDANTTQVSADMAADLNRLLDAFETQGSPALRRTIAHERARLGLSTVAGLTMNQLWQRMNDRWSGQPCVAGDFGLCLSGGRYRVEADWATPAGGIGGGGRGRAMALSGDSGYFWFFDPANVELLTKIVDGCGANQRTWSYSAGLTNLEVDLFVFDTATGRGKSYRNPQATNFAPVLDSDYLECVPAPFAAEASATAASPPVHLLPLGAGGCVPGAETLCLEGGRFRVEADWRTAAGASGAAHAVPLTDDTGTFWFFQPANIELVVKTIDACGLAGFENYRVFAGGTTDVEVEMRVTDTLRNVTKIYRRPLGVPFAPILDSGAFSTCP